MARYRAGGIEGLAVRSRAKRTSFRLTANIEAVIHELRRPHRRWVSGSRLPGPGERGEPGLPTGVTVSGGIVVFPSRLPEQ